MNEWQDRETLLAKVKEQMHDKRFRHTLGVAESARQLAVRYGADPDKAELAGLLHDYCKCWPVDKMREVLIDHNQPQELLDGEKELWHAFAGAIVVQSELGVTDEEIIDAVRYHTTGRAGMSLLEKVICVADYIEPNRNYPGVDDIRELSKKDLDAALALALGSTIQHLIEKRKTVYPLTLIAYNELVSLGGKEGGF